MIPSSAPAGLLVVAFAVTAPVFQPACDSTNPTPPAGDEVFTAADGTRFQAETVVRNLEVPWSLAFAPDGRLFITERPGRVRVVQDGVLLTSPALTLADVFATGEAGLLGLVLDPAFTQNRYVYLLYTRARPGLAPVNRVARFRELNNTLAEAVVLLDDIPAANSHDGGRLRFGPDGALYITMGDARDLDAPQDLASLSGKILRINPDGTTPADNPFASPVYSYGHRNPQGLDWHPVTGELWATEHGDVGNDEVNRIDAGANYGWPVIEDDATMPGMLTPVRAFSPAIAPSGASFYTGQALAGFRDDLFFATLRGEHLHRVRFDPANPSVVASDERLLEGRFGRLRDVMTGPDGALYLITSNRDGRGTPADDDDRVIRLVPGS